MKKNIPLIILAIAAITFFYFRNQDSSTTYVADEQTNQMIQFCDHLPMASVTIDTLYKLDTPLHKGGVIFTAKTVENMFALAEFPIRTTRDVPSLVKLRTIGMEHGNYAVGIMGKATKCLTAKHLMEENMARVRDYDWYPDSLRDVMIQSLDSKVDGEGRIAYVSSADFSSSGDQVEVYGYRIYPDKPYILRFKIRGIPTKALPALLNGRPSVAGSKNASAFSNQQNKYVLRVPLQYQDDLMGLSGSGVYLIDKKGNATDTLVGIQSDRLMLGEQNPETGATHVMYLALAFEKM